MEKINIAELLKDCPKGMELDCTIFDGTVILESINIGDAFPINIRLSNGNLEYLTKIGGVTHEYLDKCVIFPKGKNTWEGFHRPFKDGDIVTSVFQGVVQGTGIFDYEEQSEAWIHVCINLNNEFFTDGYLGHVYDLRLATEKEEEKLFQAIKENGYKWNAETKTLEKAGELQPYKKETMDKVNKAVFDANAQCCDIMNHLIKEETMESKPNLLQQLKDYFDNTPRDVIEKEWHEYDKYNEIGPKVNEYLEYVNKSRRPKYPKTYDECCDVLGLSYMQLGVVGYKCETLHYLQQLLLYRDAYWKLAGDWKPNVEDEKQDKYAISNVGGKMSPEYYGSYNSILCFPTREIRDIFFETFKDVIEECKELL